MSEVTPELPQVVKNKNTVSLVTGVPSLAIWIGVLARITINRAEICGLVLICCLMISY